MHNDTDIAVNKKTALLSSKLMCVYFNLSVWLTVFLPPVGLISDQRPQSWNQQSHFSVFVSAYSSSPLASISICFMFCCLQVLLQPPPWFKSHISMSFEAFRCCMSETRIDFKTFSFISVQSRAGQQHVQALANLIHMFLKHGCIYSISKSTRRQHLFSDWLET